ncbi:hypothetical protein ACIBCT_35665 [Streptosporangium sp. NPDC050855]|uniref:hypothetical protein n=1 Tax=Streptosporangium sp. NPDC050855 TaxID=3366194 RepID=UPI003793EA76
MPANYPATLRGWSTKRDFQDPIFAAHFNQVQDEVAAIERTLGLMPHKATNNPADRTVDYGTVTDRILAAARAEPMITYRGSNIGAQVVPNEYFRPRLDPIEDTHDGAHGTGYRIPQTGYWVIVAKADWHATSQSQQQITSRILSLEINAKDVGLRDVLLETDGNRDSMTTTVTWQENLVEGTDITVALHAILADVNRAVAPVNVYLRCYLVRCLNKGGPGIPNSDFDPDPPPPPPPPPDDGCRIHTSYEPPPKDECKQTYTVRFSSYMNRSYTYDNCGNAAPSEPRPPGVMYEATPVGGGMYAYDPDSGFPST